mmetsp:Transcript_14983/g.38289  ORF Transcript_14983/g.38289 Transcript_14983/m.38289 type:complete len:245 (-) Transcript_14983:301-1035(-)
MPGSLQSGSTRGVKKKQSMMRKMSTFNSKPVAGSFEEHQANLAKTRKIEDIATLARSASTMDNKKSPSRKKSSAEVQSPPSFSAALYQTMALRVGDVPDIGPNLEPSPVRGDGRCLFRSVAKANAHANGVRNWSEDRERNTADALRAKAVQELVKNRELLTMFFVIEDDFDKHVRRMQGVRTFGGEPELLMLAAIVHRPIAVYIQQDRSYRQIQVYGRQYTREALSILYVGSIHYDCLIPRSSF